MKSCQSSQMRRTRVQFNRPIVEQFEPRCLLSAAGPEVVCKGDPLEIHGTSGDDRIVITFVNEQPAVSGAADIADGTVLTDACDIRIYAGDGNDRVEIGNQPLHPRRPKRPRGIYFWQVYGGAGDDELIGNNGTDTLDGGAGNDKLVGNSNQTTLEFNDATGGVDVDLGQGKVFDDGFGDSDVVSGVASVRGTPYADRVVGGALAGDLAGGEGDDLLVGSSTANVITQLFGDKGNDTLKGGAGTDWIVGGAGSDVISGGGGTDTAVFSQQYGMTHGAVIRLDRGIAKDDGSGGRDTLSGFEKIEVWSKFDDVIYGDNGPNIIMSGPGGNLLSGSGRDLIVGRGGNDVITSFGGTILGGAGNDDISARNWFARIDGAAGRDTIHLYGTECSTGKILKNKRDSFSDFRVPPTDNPGERCTELDPNFSATRRRPLDRRQ